MTDIRIVKKFFIVLFFIILAAIAALLILFGIYFFDDKDYCLDTSICKKGLKINTEHGLIKINKENCIKYGWVWNKKVNIVT